jgi:hypothetical protein
MAMRRVLEYIIVGNSRGFEAAENRVNAGLRRLSTQSQRSSRDLGLVDKQIMAIGTTARYAFAGQLVFGVTAAIQALTQFQNQIGTLASLTGQNIGGNYQAPSQGFLGQLGNEAQLAANRVGVATDDIQSYMTRFYSAFGQKNPESRRSIQDMRGFVGEVSKLAAMMGAEAGDPQALAGGIAGFVSQIPGGRRNIARTTNRVANMIGYLTQQTPNITGADIARDIGRVGASGLAQAGLTPQQIFAVWTQAGMAGGSSSVIGRGISQMFSNMLHPNTPDQIKAYQTAGLPTDPNALRRMGAFNVLERMIRSATTGPTSFARPGALTNEGIDDPVAAIQASGARGINLNQVYGLFTRQESARQFVNLIAQGGVSGLKRSLDNLNTNIQHNTVAQRERAALNQRTLARFATARGNISLSMARGIEMPLEHVIAPPVIAASNFLAGHTRSRTAVDAALGAVLLSGGIKRFLRMRRAGGATAAGALLTAEAAPNLVGQTSVQPTGARDNPIWVMIHPASWYVGSPGGMSTPTGPNGPNHPHGSKSWFSWLKNVPVFIGKHPVLARSVRAAPPALIASVIANTPSDQGPGTNNDPDRIYNHFKLRGGGSLGVLGDPIMRAMQYANFKPGSLRDVTITGRASADLVIRLVDAQGRTIVVSEHKGVPVGRWKKDNEQSKGKRTNQRGK